MDKSPKRTMTLKEALADHWQVPVFLLSVLGFSMVIVALRPRQEQPGFEDRYAALERLLDQRRYQEFYANAELLRQECDSGDELGRVHRLSAEGRVQELRDLTAWGLIPASSRSMPENYEAIIEDYRQAMKRNKPKPDGAEASAIFRDLAYAYWCLNDPGKAIYCLDRAIDQSPGFQPALYRTAVRMLLQSRPSDYLSIALARLEAILTSPEATLDDRGWAFVRRQEILIKQERESESLRELEQVSDDILNSSYGNEVQLLLGQALYKAGRTEESDTFLRTLLGSLEHGSELFRRTALVLGQINYEQGRDYDAQRFFESVEEDQAADDWVMAARLGLAGCMTLQQRYPEAVTLYQQVADYLGENPYSRTLEPAMVRRVLAMEAYKQSLLCQYEWALAFLEIEQQLGGDHDADALERFAQTHAYRASQLQRELVDRTNAAEILPPVSSSSPGGASASGNSPRRTGSNADRSAEAGEGPLADGSDDGAAGTLEAAGDSEGVAESAAEAALADESQAGPVGNAAAQADSRPASDWRSQLRERINHHFVKAAESFLQVAQLSASDDERYAESLWQAARCYDSAGELEDSIGTWELFCEEHMNQPRWPEAAFNLAQAYQSMGDYEQAIINYEQLIDLHPNSPSAFDAMVPLARCYLQRETPDHAKAEELLQAVLDNRALTPLAPYFREAMFELGDLYYSDGNYPMAIRVLSEAIDRYPNDPALGKSLFFVGESYHRSGLELDESLAEMAEDASAMVRKEETTELRRRYLSRARRYYDQAVDWFEAVADDQRSRLDDLYLQQAYLSRADCVFEMGRYAEAIDLYDVAALRYQLTPSALNALIQIMNCHLFLEDTKAARSAYERAMWQFRKMGSRTESQQVAAVGQEEWREWFQWVEESGLW